METETVAKKEFDTKLAVVCIKCGGEYVIEVNVKDYLKWRGGNGMIQNVLPYLTPAEREMLITGYCDDCFTKACSDG